MFDVPDVSRFMSAVESPQPEMIEAMQYDGVLPRRW
jgi:hypothetical protein